MIVDYWLAAFLSLVGVFVFLGIAVGVGSHVTRKYPDRNDPDRNAARYVRPAGVATLLAFLCLLALIVFAILGIVT